MNELRQQWVEALRSGEYAQGRGALCRSDGFCCLGVIADIVDPQAWEEIQLNADRKLYSFYNNTVSLNNDVLKKLGISEDEQDELIYLNDDLQLSFEEIADFIEAGFVHAHNHEDGWCETYGRESWECDE